jgi:hypothetical protein
MEGLIDHPNKESYECERLKRIYYEACNESGTHCLDQFIDILEGHSPTGTLLNLKGNLKMFQRRKLHDRDFLPMFLELQTDVFITRINLAYNQLSDYVCKSIGRALETNETLIELDCTMCDISHDGCSSISEGLKENARLQSILLSGNKFGPVGAAAIAEALLVNRFLKSLSIANTDQNSQSLIPISSVLRSNSSIEYLDVSRTVPYTDELNLTNHFSKLLSLTVALSTLKMSKCDITDSGANSLAFYLRGNTSLKHLDVSCNKISADGAKSFADLLKVNSTLEELSLCSNRIGDNGMIAISEVLACRNSSLTKLWVPNNTITEVGLSSLAIALRSNKSISNIYIWGNEFGEKACDAFRLLCCGENPRLQPDNIDFQVYTVDNVNYLAETGQYSFSH